jgi:hypothetical protein
VITISSQSKSYGNTKNYVARLTGRHSSMTFAREFMGKEALIDEAGLFEECDIDKRGNKDQTYVLVLPLPEPVGGEDLRRFSADKEDAMKIARRLDEGETLDQIVVAVPRENREQYLAENPGRHGYVYRIQTKGEAKKATAAATITSATQDCWKVLSLLPEREAKKVLAALKARVSPPKAPAFPETPAAQTASEANAVVEAPVQEGRAESK